MAGPLLYTVVAVIIGLAPALVSGENETGNGDIHVIFVNGTSTNVSRVSNDEELRDHGRAQRIQIGNITTITNSTRPTKDYYYCALEWWIDRLYWSTPDFGIQNYPNNAECSLWGGGVALAEFKFVPLDLQKKVSGECVDYFQFTFPYGVTKRWCGNKTGKKFRIPTYNYEAKFISDNTITRTGFNISIEFLDSPCHQFIYTYNVGESGEFETPNYPNLDTVKNRMCEFVVYNYYGYRIQLDFLDFDLNPPCSKNNVVINLQNDWYYSQSTSSRYCGNTLPPSMISTWNEAHLVYQAKKRNRGFKVKYTVVY